MSACFDWPIHRLTLLAIAVGTVIGSVLGYLAYEEDEGT